jgi:NADH-quinone oxidoreductase subunit N
MSALGLELGVLALMLLIFCGGLFGRRDDTRRVGVIAGLGLVVLLGVALRMEPGARWLGEGFVQDELALFAKRLFLLATVLGVLGSLTLRAPVFARRATEYYLLMLSSLLGMLMLASARDLILLFVAFELMSIPLYVLAGFQKGEEMAVEAALKFFLVGTVSSALIAYGLSFVYGISRTTALPGVASALSAGSPLLVLGLALTLAGLGFKIAAFPFHMWVPDTYEAANAPFVAWLSVAPKAAGFIVIFRLYLEGVGDRAVLWVPVASGLAALTILAGNLMAIPQQNVKRLLAYSGIAHIGYMLIGFAAVSANGVAMMLFYLVAYLFGNMGAFLVVEAVSQSKAPIGSTPTRGSPSARPCWRWPCCSFSSPWAAFRSWPASGRSSMSSGPPPTRDSTGWCCWARFSPWWRSSITSWWPRGCTSTRRSVQGPSRSRRCWRWPSSSAAWAWSSWASIPGRSFSARFASPPRYSRRHGEAGASHRVRGSRAVSW